MTRRLRAEVGESAVLYDFLRATLGLTKKQIRQVKYHQPGILVNGEHRKVTALLSPGDVVEVDMEGNAEPKPLALNASPVDILYEDEDLICVNKPAGVPTHPGGIHQTDTLVNMLMYYFREKGESLVLRPAGRLDKDTSGVILFSKNQLSAGRMVRQKERGILRKEYLAMVSGVPGLPEGTIRTPLRRDPGNACRVIEDEAGKPAVTHYRVIRDFGTGCLVHVRIDTGRMHQIRVHMAGIGHPLLGDVMYGGPGDRIARAALHAANMQCRQPVSGEALHFEAPLPADMQVFLPESARRNS